MGRHVFVHCPGARPPGVALTDDAGLTVPFRLEDGVEVEVLAWRPRGAGGPRYRVGTVGDRREGWLSATALRVGRHPEPTKAPPPVGPVPRPPTGRRFGER